MIGLICVVTGHRRDGARVWDDGYNFRAPCRKCGFPMIKTSLGGWRTFDSSRDFADGVARKSRPTR